MGVVWGEGGKCKLLQILADNKGERGMRPVAGFHTRRGGLDALACVLPTTPAKGCFLYPDLNVSLFSEIYRCRVPPSSSYHSHFFYRKGERPHKSFTTPPQGGEEFASDSQIERACICY